MRLKYKGEYNNDESTLPQREHPETSVQFREAENSEKFAVIMTVISLVVTFVLAVLVSFISKKSLNFMGIFLSLVCLVPHEILHAICFKEDVELYTFLKKGMLFVIGTEDMSKARFVFMSILPTIVFGFIPLILFFINNEWITLGTLGAFSIGAGAGDFYNIFNCITQVPKGAKVYNSGFHTYWYK